jgi:mannose-1-phosphate guanylyltransferase
MAVHAIVLAGGAGTRFWPASRSAMPKQLLALVGSTSLLEATVRRIAPLVPPSNVVVATGAHLLGQTREALASHAGVQFFAEPTPRNTAPCIAWVTADILRRDPDALCVVLPSDHFITAPTAFIASASRALDAARLGFLATIGITPTRPDTGFGYIEIGREIENGIREAKRFVEKPDRARAEEYVASGQFAWNAGMFFYSARTMMDAVREHMPELAAGIDEMLASPNAVDTVFPKLPAISIDHGVMEKARSVAVVAGDFGWSDLGSWESAWELASKDANGNVAPDGSVLIDARGNLIWDRSEKKRTYALVGVSDLVIVETDDAVLIVPRSRAQDVKLVVEELRAAGIKRI